MLMEPRYLWLPLLMSNDHNAKILWHGDYPLTVKASRTLVCLLGGINESYEMVPFKNLKKMKIVRLVA